MKGILSISGIYFEVIFDSNSEVAKEFYKNLPVEGSGINLGGEIYFRIPGIDIAYDGTERTDFKPGDVTYWRSPTGEASFSIAIFYGTTPFGRGVTTRAASPCIRIGKITSVYDNLHKVESGEIISISL